MLSPVIYTIFPIVLAVLANIIIFNLELNKNTNNENKYIPNGAIVGIIWTIQFGLLGYLFYLLNLNKSKILSKISIIILLSFCLAYPFITQFEKDISKILNIVAFALTLITGIIVNYEMPKVTIYIIPLFIWTLYVVITDNIV
jgi:hypothetical protein